MHSTALRSLVVAASVIAALLPCRAEVTPDTLPGGCEIPSAGVNPLADRAGLLARYEGLPKSCLDSIFTRCSRAAAQGLLDFSSAAVCSFSYEALLRRHFDGDFPALVAWWRSRKDESPAVE